MMEDVDPQQTTWFQRVLYMRQGTRPAIALPLCHSDHGVRKAEMNGWMNWNGNKKRIKRWKVEKIAFADKLFIYRFLFNQWLEFLKESSCQVLLNIFSSVHLSAKGIDMTVLCYTYRKWGPWVILISSAVSGLHSYCKVRHGYIRERLQVCSLVERGSLEEEDKKP